MGKAARKNECVDVPDRGFGVENQSRVGAKMFEGLDGIVFAVRARKDNNTNSLGH